MVVSWQDFLLTFCESGKNRCIIYWSTDHSRWKRKFIQGCYMTHFSMFCSNLSNKISVGKKKKIFQNVIFPPKTSSLDIWVSFYIWIFHRIFFCLSGHTLRVKVSPNKRAFITLRWKSPDCCHASSPPGLLLNVNCLVLILHTGRSQDLGCIKKRALFPRCLVMRSLPHIVEAGHPPHTEPASGFFLWQSADLNELC